LIEIAKALTLNAKIIILDEPAAAITKNEGGY
jgi:ABC-type sugar transport system ATPase subunit